MRGRQIAKGIALLSLGLTACSDSGQPLYRSAALGGGLEALGAAPSFSLVDQSGGQFESGSLEGRYWVANFIFTRCRTMCPMLSGRMRELQTRLADDPAGDGVRLVSFSVDPEHDRPAVLAEYALRYDADPDRWSFVTGEREEIWNLSTAGFKLAVGEAPAEAGEPLFHSDRFVLVDSAGQIRGYYPATQSESLDVLIGALHRLIETSEPE